MKKYTIDGFDYRMQRSGNGVKITCRDATGKTINMISEEFVNAEYTLAAFPFIVTAGLENLKDEK